MTKQFCKSSFVVGCALALLPVLLPLEATCQTIPPPKPRPAQSSQPAGLEPAANPQTGAKSSAAPRTTDPIAEVTLADIGFVNGLRLSNLGGHRELYMPLPQDGEVSASDLVLSIDDLSAHEAKRHLEVQANDRTVAAISLDGKTRGRVVRIALGKMRPKDGYLKLSFLYSGAATIDRCIDVRYVGDSVTIRPETAVEVDLGRISSLDVATTAMLMPREVSVVLPGRRVTESEIATAVTVARSLISSGRRVTFHHGYDATTDLAKRDAAGHWARGVVLIGPIAEAANVIDQPLTRVAGAMQPLGMLAAVRVGGLPALVVSDSNVVRAGRLFASPLRAATRGVAAASVGESVPIDLPVERATFEQLAVAPAQAEVYGRADLTTTIDIRRLPPETRPTRLLLDVMVAPDGAGEKAVVSAFVNERLLGSTVAAIGEPTHLDLNLPDGLFGTVANVRALVQRDSLQGECRFEAQGYPAQILGSSSLALTSAQGAPHDFSDLIPHFARGVMLLLPVTAADQPTLVLGTLAEVTSQLSPDSAPINVTFVGGIGTPTPDSPFIALGDKVPSGATPRVRFDRGRVVVTDRAGHTLLDLGGFVGGAVAQLVTASDHPGVWIKPLGTDGSAPAPSELHLDHGDVAFIDGNGVALAMSTERDTVVNISYPDQVSWLTVAERFRSWIIGALWLFATAALLFILQRMFRRQLAKTGK